MGGKGSGGYRPNAGNQLPLEDAQLNARILAMGKELRSLEPVSLADAAAVGERFELYLDLCAKKALRPTVAGAALALGTNRQRIWEIANGQRTTMKGEQLTPDAVDSLKRIYDFLEFSIDSLLTESPKNPASLIFLSKNHFGYRDTTEQVVRRVDERPALRSADEVAAALAARLGVEELPEAEVVDVEDAAQP